MLRLFRDDVVEEVLGLAQHRRQQRRVRVRRLVQAADLEPLPHEILRQRDRLRILQHPRDVRVEVGAQRAVLRRHEQLLVRHRAPEEIREAARELVLRDLEHLAGAVRIRIALDAEQELRRHQRRAGRKTGRLIERLARVRERERGELHQLVDLALRHRAAERARREHFEIEPDLRLAVGEILPELRARLVDLVPRIERRRYAGLATRGGAVRGSRPSAATVAFSAAAR